tara:strand:- start:34 stop:312 length:279 start_codon:yes stop_codon:yes gene_type:complete
MNLPIKKYCDKCNKKTWHESYLTKKELLKKGRFNSGGWYLLGILTVGISFMFTIWFVKEDEINYCYKDKCEICGFETSISMLGNEDHIRTGW